MWHSRLDVREVLTRLQVTATSTVKSVSTTTQTKTETSVMVDTVTMTDTARFAFSSPVFSGGSYAEAAGHGHQHSEERRHYDGANDSLRTSMS